MWSPISLVLALSVAASAGPAWSQDQFFISFWVGPQVAESELDERFGEIAEANFTGYLGFDGQSGSPFRPNASRVAKEIELCDKYGLRCVPSLCGKTLGSIDSPCIEMGKSSKNFWGFQLFDEPGQKLFPRIGNWTKQLAVERPEALNYVNLLGDTPYHSVDEYRRYIADFVSNVQPQVLSMDFYPTFSDQAAPQLERLPQTKENYGTTLQVLRQQSEAAPGGPIPFWNFFNAMPFNTAHSDPTEAMLRWQAMTALAYGASGVMYFCYW
jgi:hypothetical protein